jgi:hypothetical protein
MTMMGGVAWPARPAVNHAVHGGLDVTHQLSSTQSGRVCARKAAHRLSCGRRWVDPHTKEQGEA